MSARSLRVALLSPAFWPEVRRGTERYVRELADGLIERGHRPTLLTSHPGRPHRSLEDGLEVVRNWRPPEGRLRRRMFEEYLTHLPLSYLSLVRGDFDLAHSFYPTDALAAGRWAARSGKPAVFSHMGIPHRRGLANRRLRAEISLRACTESSAVVVLSHAAARACERWLGIRARVIEPGFDLRVFSPGGTRAKSPTIVCAAAAEVQRKRVPLLIESFTHVRRERSDARLLLAQPRLQRNSLPFAAQPGVEFAQLDGGRGDRARLADVYRAAWVCALPSRDEAFGFVLAEALACGTPGVGTRDGGIPEVIDRPGVGVLFDGDDPQVLARALLDALELAADPGTAAACRARAEELSMDRCVERYLALYRELGAGC